MLPTESIGGTAEVAELLGCSRQQIWSLRRKPEFPQPVLTLSATPLWDLRAVKEFKTTWRRRK